MGQVERVAAKANVPLHVYLDLVRQTIDNVEQLGATAALTGPVARGDAETVERHLAAIDPSERNTNLTHRGFRLWVLRQGLHFRW